METGVYEPTWESLSQYGQAPDWFRDVKFGIWAHWGPQCQPEQGDWYARFMYDEGSPQYKWHVENYGHPSEFGFKDVINSWKAENWKPDELMALYKRVGAQYFFTLGIIMTILTFGIAISHMELCEFRTEERYCCRMGESCSCKRNVFWSQHSLISRMDMV